MDYELFHDESNISGYWHGILLVPSQMKQDIYELCEKSRKNVKYSHKVSFKNVRGKGKIYDLSSCWLSLAIGFMRSQPGHDNLYANIGHQDLIRLSDSSLGVKFILFIERDNHKNMLRYPDHASKIETSFRFALKGGLHYLFSKNNPVNVTRIHFDGHEHYHRSIDRGRIINRIEGLRNYCSIDSSEDIIDDRSSDHEKDNSQDYIDCQLIQLTDLVIGAFRAGFGYYKNRYQWKLSHFARKLINKYSKGFARMRNSRWDHSFCMSQCYLENDNWCFMEIESEEVSNKWQLQLHL